jgi:serine/threonine-protein kinase
MEATLPGNGTDRECLDHYRLDQLIATSTTARIYRATDLRTGRQVAVKLPHVEVEGDSLFYQRVQRERQIGQKLDHPSIVKFLPDSGRSRAYLVMEWVEGLSLRRILNESGLGKLPHDRALRLASSLCEALEYLHSQGVVHRDLKPENILVDTSPEGFDRIRIIDFGIAGMAGSRRLTFGRLSQVMGTPDYISPEQVRGKRGDARSDIYAIGVILYEMLTGTTPFPGENPFAVMNLRLVDHPVPPREADPAISPELQEILYRALERDPVNRYARAHELAWDLQHLDQVVVEDRPEIQKARRKTNWFSATFRPAAVVLISASVFAVLLYAASHT